jgi:hypothetical protein
MRSLLSLSPLAVASLALSACGTGIDFSSPGGLFGLDGELGTPDSATDDDGTADQGGDNNDDATGEIVGGDDNSADDNSADDDSEACVARCRFDRYNLDVRVGDTFVLTNFVTCPDVLAHHSFAADGGDWAQLDDANAGVAITITTDDAEGGNHGDGEWRINLVDERGEEVDHATIRVNHDDESDITAADAVARDVDVDCDDDSSDDDGTADQGGENDDDTAGEIGGEVGGDDDGTADQGGENNDDTAGEIGGDDDGTADQGGANDDDVQLPG